MNNDFDMDTSHLEEQVSKGNEISNESETAIPTEIIPSMKEFEDQITNSLHKIEEGELVKGTVIGISDTEVTVDLGYYAEGIIRLEDLSNDPRFSIKADIAVGDEISATVIQEDDGKGNILLSKKEADNILAWETLKEYMANKKICKVKIAQVVNGGVVTYLEGIRAFIPASQLSLNYVEDLDSWLNKMVDVVVITVDEDKQKLVLSGKEVEQELAASEKKSKISRLQIGLVTNGIVDKIMPYGAFVTIGDGLSGLLHISQISRKRIKSPNEVIKEGQEVTVKITEVKDGKISLSMKAIEEEAQVVESVDEVPFEYSTGGEASTGLAALLSNLKL